MGCLQEFARLTELVHTLEKQKEHMLQDGELVRELEFERKLNELLDEYGAVAIISDEALILSLSSADVTQRAIALMDRRLPAPEGETPPPSTPPASAPNPEQGSPPAPVNP